MYLEKSLLGSRKIQSFSLICSKVHPVLLTAGIRLT
jgi:hypothetical protein